MVQQAHQAHVHNHEIIKPITEKNQIFAAIMKSFSQVIRKMAVWPINGFHDFVGIIEGTEYPNVRREEYWWESPESAKKIITG